MTTLKKPKSKSSTIKDVAEYVNLSVATVSRVINGSRPVNSGLSQKVWEAVETLNYKPNVAARFIKGQRTGNIALIIPDIADPFFGHIAKGVLFQAHKNGVMVNISSSQGKREIERESIKQLASFVIDGLLYAPVATAEPLPQMDIFRGLPLVVIGRRFIFKNVPHLYTDNIKGGYTATKYLLTLGRKKIAFLAGFWDPPCSAEEIPQAALADWAGAYSSLDRFIGYLDAQKEYGLELDPNLVAICGYTFESGYEAAKKLFSQMVEIDSLIAPQ